MIQKVMAKNKLNQKWASDRAKWNATYRRKHPDRVSESNRKYWASPRGKSIKKKYLAKRYVKLAAAKRKREWIERNKDFNRQIKKAWAERNKEKRKANALFWNEIRAGRIKRKPCMKCGKKAHAHHSDYSKPFKVKWLCPKHHGEEHGRIRKTAKHLPILNLIVVYRSPGIPHTVGI